MIRSRSTALRIPRGRRNALKMGAGPGSAAEPPRRDTMRDQSWFNSESAFMSPLNRQRFQRSRGYFSAYGVKPVGMRDNPHRDGDCFAPLAMTDMVGNRGIIKCDHVIA